MPQFSRILILGLPASGKTTLAKRLSGMTNIPHVEVDRFFLQDSANFVESVRIALQGQSAWIVEGHFKAVGPIVSPHVDAVIWLDAPRARVLFNWFLRALKRRDFEGWEWIVLMGSKLRLLQEIAVNNFKKHGIPVFRGLNDFMECYHE